jgi:prepilin-type processing-associated H-X9-DG protein
MSRSLYPYVKSKQVYVCPDDAEGQRSGDSYAVNSCTQSSKAGANQPFLGKSLAAFNDTSSIMLLGEEAQSNPAVNSTDDAYFRQQDNTFSSRHTSGTNVAFIDCHVKWYLPARIVSLNLQSQTPNASDCPP